MLRIDYDNSENVSRRNDNDIINNKHEHNGNGYKYMNGNGVNGHTLY